MLVLSRSACMVSLFLCDYVGLVYLKVQSNHSAHPRLIIARYHYRIVGVVLFKVGKVCGRLDLGDLWARTLETLPGCGIDGNRNMQKTSVL